MTSRKQLFQIFEEITEKAFQIMEGKNSDYASDEDSLANFRSSEVLNVDSRKALLIRMLDKIKRQVNYIERGELSVDSAEDDVIDLINYSVLLHALNREEERSVIEQDDPFSELNYEQENKFDVSWLLRQDVTEYDNDMKTYKLLSDIDGLGEKGGIIEVPSHYKIWEYVNSDEEMCGIHLEDHKDLKRIDNIPDQGEFTKVLQGDLKKILDEYIPENNINEWLEEDELNLCDCKDTKACVENEQCLESTSTPIKDDDGYIVDEIREYEDGYEVCSGDEGARFKNEKIKGVYFDRMGTPKKLEVDDGRVYKIEEDSAYDVDEGFDELESTGRSLGI